MAKLTSLEEFKSQKEELLEKLVSLQETIDSLKIENENKVNDIEKKVIIDNDRYLFNKNKTIKSIYIILFFFLKQIEKRYGCQSKPSSSRISKSF